MKLYDMKTEDYIELLASDAPAPGGGSASALCGAQGAALAEMVARLTLGREKYAGHFTICENAAKELKPLREALLLNVERDALAYNELSSAYKLPKTSEEEKADRHGKIQIAVLNAALLPLETLQLAREAAIKAAELCGHSNTSCASDIGVSALMLRSCGEGAKLNVEINLESLKDKEKAARLQSRADEMMRELEDYTEIMLKYAKSCI